MSYVIVFLEPAGKGSHLADVPPGSYLVWFDPDAYDGRGDALWTQDPERAMRFESPAEAVRLYRLRSSVRPLREDGRPNRPLTAASVMIAKEIPCP